MFPRLDVEHLKVTLKVEKQGIHQGSQDLPSSSDTTLDASQDAIITHLRGVYLSAVDKASQTLSRLRLRRRELLNTLDPRQILAEAKEVPTIARTRVVELEAEKRAHLKFLRVEQLKAQRQYNVFREENELTHREAHYPESFVYHWAVIAAFIFGESLANSYFFKDATDSGFLGGIFVATLISVVNVLVAAAVLGSQVLPQFNHVRPFRRFFFGGVGTAICVLVIFLINLAAAHTRAIISRAVKEGSLASTEAFREAILALKERPFAVDNFEAWMLFVIGLIIAFSAAIKGYTADDPYPNYGHEDRLRRKAQAAYALEQTAYFREVTGRIRTVEESMHSLRAKVRQAVQGHDLALEESRRTIDDCRLFVQHLNDVAKSLLRTYRDINRRVRTSPPPGYFTEEVNPFDSMVASLPPIEKNEEDASQLNNDLLKTLERLIQENRGKLLQLQQEYSESVPEFYKHIDAEAEVQLSAEANLGSKRDRGAKR